MSFLFNPNRGLILVKAEVVGPNGSAFIRLALDTGATHTLVRMGVLVALGYDPANSLQRVQVTTASGVEFTPRVVLDKISALGHEHRGLLVVSHTLPPSASVDGLLGLDFLRGLALTIDFRSGRLHLA